MKIILFYDGNYLEALVLQIRIYIIVLIPGLKNMVKLRWFICI